MEEHWSLSHAQAQMPAQEGICEFGHDAPVPAQAFAHRFLLYHRMLLLSKIICQG